METSRLTPPAPRGSEPLAAAARSFGDRHPRGARCALSSPSSSSFVTPRIVPAASFPRVFLTIRSTIAGAPAGPVGAQNSLFVRPKHRRGESPGPGFLVVPGARYVRVRHSALARPPLPVPLHGLRRRDQDDGCEVQVRHVIDARQTVLVFSRHPDASQRLREFARQRVQDVRVVKDRV